MSVKNSKNIYVLGIDAGGTYFKSVLVNDANEVVSSSQKKYKTTDDKESIIECYTTVISEAKEIALKEGGTLVGVGVSTPGPFDYCNTVSLMKHKLKSIYGVNLKETLKNKGVLNDLQFCCMHDGLAFLYGEYLIGEAKDYPNAACVTLGTGTGFSIIKNGVLCENEQGSTAFDIYDNPLNGKKVEDFLSGRGIVQMYKQFSNSDNEYTVYDLEKLATDKNDAAAKKTFYETGRLIGVATKDILQENGINCLVLGGQISRAFPLMEDGIKEGLGTDTCVTKICAGKSIDFSAQIGVAHRVFSAINVD